MTNENTEIVVSHQEIDLKVEAKKQLRIATVDYLLNRLINWVDSKLSA